jgi:cell division septation protein DedD
MMAAGALAIVTFASYWQAQFDDEIRGVWAPEAPLSPYEPFALNFAPQRAKPSVPPASSAEPGGAVAVQPPVEAGIFAIDVALFSSSSRASRLVVELGASGYPAYVKDLDLGQRGQMYEVIVGPFSSRADADTEVERIHAIPGYGDARVVSSAP